jgi:hypothetical protein
MEKYVTTRQATVGDIVRRLRFACWIIKATNTLRVCDNYCFSPEKKKKTITLTRLMLRYMYIARLF